MSPCAIPPKSAGGAWAWLLAGILSGFAVLLGLLAATGCAATPEAPPPLTAEQRDAYTRSFDQVWTTVRDKHWDSTLGGVDWEKVRAELRPRVESAQTGAQARAVLTEMLGRVGKSHYGIIPAEAYTRLAAERESGARGEAEPGITVRIIDDRAVVWRVREGSPAQKAGVTTGWIIRDIAGRPVDPAIAAVRAAMPGSTAKDFTSAMVVQSRLRGSPGDSLNVTFLSADDREKTIPLALEIPPGERTQFGNLPPMRVVFESRRLADDVGYFTFSPFFAPAWLMPKIQEFVGASSDCRGMIIDLRGNPGGIIPMTSGIAGFFVSQPDTKLGRMVTRESTLNLVVNPRLGGFSGPVAVLVDGSSISSSEILAGGLQDIGRARVFGARSAGACLPSVVEKLPSGDGFQYAFANYISAGGQELEGRGVIPDEPVQTTRQALLAGRDETVEAALRWIQRPPSASR